MKDECGMLLSEYHEAEKAGRHHDELLWVVTSIILSGVLILIGLIINNISQLSMAVVIYLSIFVSICLLCLLRIASDFRKIKLFFYNKSAEIEKVIKRKCLNEKIALLLEHNPGSGGQWELYNILIVFTIISLWVFVILFYMGI